MEIKITINEKTLKWAVILIFGAIILTGIIGFVTNAMTPEGFAQMQAWK